MRTYSRSLGGWAIAALIGALPAHGHAQTAAPASTAASAPLSDKRVQAARGRQEQRISELHQQLKITPAQQPQWDAFTAVMHDNLTHMHEVYGQHADHGDSTALDDMRAYAAITTAHAQDVQKLVPAFEALYATMTPEQRKAADSVFHQYARQQARRMPTRE